jgi:predicted HTH transcriptional regulator
VSRPELRSGEELAVRLQQWLNAQEGERFEFKEAKNRSSFDDLTKYCCALANEGGGRVILGVADTPCSRHQGIPSARRRPPVPHGEDPAAN